MTLDSSLVAASASMNLILRSRLQFGILQRLALAFCVSLGSAEANPPSGADATITILEDTLYRFQEADFGFSDPNDAPPDRFSAVVLTSLPAAGRLAIEGTEISVGTIVPRSPLPELNWTPRGPNTACSTVTSSADGSTLAALCGGETSFARIYISTDSGETWNAREESRRWTDIACSADGKRLVAVAAFDGVYTSEDSGQSWTARAESLNWSAVASSADGTKLAATVNQGQIYISQDSGATWTATGESEFWSSIALSEDGTKVFATDKTGWIHVSYNSGATWLPRANSKGWVSVACSADGTKVLAAGQEPGGFPGRLYVSSDSGLTWMPREDTRSWIAVASSSDGSKLVAVPSSGQIFVSQDFGMTWLPRETDRGWSSCASSADGTRLIAGSWRRGLYTSVESVPEIEFIPAKDASSSPYASFTFQVADDGEAGLSVDPSPNTITINVIPVNDPPVIRTPVENLGGTEAVAFSYQFPADTFSDVESGYALQYSVRMSDESPLPEWLKFSPATRILAGTPGPRDTGRFELKVAAMDDAAPPGTGSAHFVLTVKAVDEAPSGRDGSAYLAGADAYTFLAEDFGFSDPNDFPAHLFTRVKLTTLPGAGILTVDGVPAIEGQFVSPLPTALGSQWSSRGTSQNWRAIASSRDGSRMVAVSSIGRIYTSADTGATWTERESARAWYAVASDEAGVRLAAVVRPGQIYTSDDSGITWTPRATHNSWTSIDCSADGSTLVAVGSSSRVHVSRDYGATWTPKGDSQSWYSVCSSSDGSRFAAVVWNGTIHTSADSGETWTARESRRSWWGITSSSDGATLAAIPELGRIYLSRDFGLTWTATENSRWWQSIKSSADGNTLAAVAKNDRIYVSTNAGGMWKPLESLRDWRGVVVSPDAGTIAAVGNLSPIFVSTPQAAQVLAYTRDLGSPDVSRSSFTFQVEDDGLPGKNRDLSPNTFVLNLQKSPFQEWAIENGLATDPLAEGGMNLIRFAFGLSAGETPGGELTLDGSIIKRRGMPRLFSSSPLIDGAFGALFAKRKESGLAYSVDISPDLLQWQTVGEVPTVLADDGLIEVCLIQLPPQPANGPSSRYFRVSIRPE